MKITFIADTHHYSKTLGTTGEAYDLRQGSDQKCLAETSEIIDSAFAQISNTDTEAVFILGDLTNDGEMISHIEFREKLYELKKNKPVYVITATHDWCCDENPRRFEGDKTYNDVPVMLSQDLPEFYKDFGPSEAIDSFITKIGTICYTVELNDKVRVLCLNDDKNDDYHAGFSEECFMWIEKQIKDANENGYLIIGIEHHLIMTHASPLICVGSVCVADRERVASRLADAGLKYMLVGHSHIQATDRFTSPNGNTITEINVGSLCGYPAPIVNVTTNDNGTISYKVDHLNEICFNERTVDAQSFLRAHTVQLLNRILECRNAVDFEKRLNALGVHIKNAPALFTLIKPLVKKIDTALVGDAFKLLKRLGLAKNISKKEIKPYYYKPLKEMINEVWLNLLDGHINTYERESTYYKLVMAVITIPSKLNPRNESFKELINLGDYVLTGGEINNQQATI
ncbi:MAG: metallophosphoesterase family protein [Eubacterium sp.]